MLTDKTIEVPADTYILDAAEVRTGGRVLCCMHTSACAGNFQSNLMRSIWISCDFWGINPRATCACCTDQYFLTMQRRTGSGFTSFQLVTSVAQNPIFNPLHRTLSSTPLSQSQSSTQTELELPQDEGHLQCVEPPDSTIHHTSAF